MADRRVGRFRIVAPLGKGGMATVWRAEDTLLGRTVALKLLAEDLAGSPSARRRFRHEAEIAMRLDHPAIAPVYASGEDDGTSWIAMRLVEGETLAARIARAPLPVDEALRVAAEVASALGYAHSQGVVHRDVTSNNVMLRGDGRVFVMDFGLARAEGLSRLTSTGVALGTYAYLAPEVLRGGRADARSDLYGLGVALYEMLTGTTPFHGERVEVLAYRAANEDAEPPSRRRAGLDGALDALVLRAIAREPDARYPDAATFAAALVAARAARDAGAGAAGDAPGAGVLPRALAPGGVVYLAVAPIGHEAGALRPLAEGLEGALRARLPSPRGPRVLGAPAPADPGAWRAFARAEGANAVLAGRLRASGARVRLELWLADPESGTRLAGAHADELPFEPFALEDAAIARARELLGEPADLSTAVTRPVRPHPAAEEHFARAVRYLERHDHEASVDGAIALLEPLVAGDAPRPEWLAALARACLMKYDLTRQRAWEGRAAEACARARALAPEAPEVLLAWADLMRVTGEEAEALAAYRRALEARPATVEGWLGLALLHGRSGRREAAEDAARRAIEVGPRDWRGLNSLGYARIRCGAFHEAIAPLQGALELQPDNARVKRNLAIALAQCDRLAEAAVLLSEVVALEPSDIAYSNLGAALFALGDRAGAMDALERATRLAPAEPLRWGFYASALHFEPGREREAAAAYDRAIALMQDQLDRNPGEPEWWARLADWLQARGREREADAAIARALAIAPDNAACLLCAAYVRHQRGDRAGTLDCLRRALAHGQGAEILRRSSEFRDLRDDPEFRRMLDAAGERHESEATAHGRAQPEERK